jgi:SAM-dependent methyltransferase
VSTSRGQRSVCAATIVVHGYAMMTRMRSRGTDSASPGSIDLAFLEQSYDVFARIEPGFRSALDESLAPRGPDMLYDLVEAMHLPGGAVAVDVGCGDGRHSFRLADRFPLTVIGVDPVRGNIEQAAREQDEVERTRPEFARRLSFVVGTAEALPLDAATAGLVWCRDVMVHVRGLDRAFAEFRRVLRPGGRALTYQMYATDRLEPREAAWLFGKLGVAASSMDAAIMESAISAAGLRIDERIVIGTEWGEWTQEQSGAGGRRLLHVARLLRDPDLYVARFGRAAYDLMLGDCFWNLYGMIGKLERRTYVLSKA